MKLRSLVAVVLAVAASSVHAAPIVMDFSNNAGLGFGIGTTQTISQNGIQMQVLSGSYEITANPEHELNLKDFSPNGVTRQVQFTLLSGLKFDFIGFDFQDGFGDTTITSDRGGSVTFNPFAAASVDLSGSVWDNLLWVRVSSSEKFGEVTFNSFTFNNEPTVPSAVVPEPETLALLAAGGFVAGRFRRRRV